MRNPQPELTDRFRIPGVGHPAIVSVNVSGTPMAPVSTVAGTPKSGPLYQTRQPLAGVSNLRQWGKQPTDGNLNVYAPPAGHTDSISTPIIPPVGILGPTANFFEHGGEASQVDFSTGQEVRAITPGNKKRSINQYQ